MIGPMEFGICLQTVIPVRSEPSHKSEMVTQVLFGELFRILMTDKGWARVQLTYDDYTGWILLNQVRVISEKEFLHLFNAETSVTLDLVQLISNQTRNSIAPLLIGSSLPGFLKGDLSILNEHYFYDGSVTEISPFDTITTQQEHLKAKHAIISDAMLYLNAPYLWGGRTPFGIDCSGLVQMVFKIKKIKLLRDASQQATLGEPLNFVSEAEPGDLAFFDDEDGNITHVGIMVDKSRIIHASGKVRIDTIDHEGIYNAEEQRYTHKLRILKRIV
jgi:gamma-D-glutamyl-L-lysine dipeptidyl-peptidase